MCSEIIEIVRRYLVSAFLEVFRNELVSLVLYGSYARCEPRPDSDINVLVVLEKLPEDRVQLHVLLDRVEEKLQEMYDRLRELGYTPALSPVVLDRESAARFRPLYIDLVFDAVILYDKGDFMKTVLERVRRKLEALGARRVRIGRRWVVDIKPDYRFGERIDLSL